MSCNLNINENLNSSSISIVEAVYPTAYVKWLAFTIWESE